MGISTIYFPMYCIDNNVMFLARSQQFYAIALKKNLAKFLF